ALVAACIVAVRAGSTRLPIDEARLGAALTPLGAADSVPLLRSILARARAGQPADPVSAVVGAPDERKPLVLDGEWLYPERMRALEVRFCARVRDRLARATPTRDPRLLARALRAIGTGPPALTDDQVRAVRDALSAHLALISGGPGTGKTTIVVALLRALSWMGEPMANIAIAAPTGKAAQRLRDAIATGLASARGDIADAGLHAVAPTPQTLHRLLGWSPTRGRFARHENDRLPHRIVVVDEASMIDLATMDRLMRALADDARLVLLGDADQLPSVDAGAVFRDLCVALRPARLSTNLRVERDPEAQRIVAAARSVNAGELDVRFAGAVVMRHSVAEVTFEGVEHLGASWDDVGDALLDRWWSERIASLDDFARRIARTYLTESGTFDDSERADLDSLFDHYARARFLCVTRSGVLATGSEAINARLLAKFRNGTEVRHGYQSSDLTQGAPVIVGRNDYERQLFNGDQGVIVCMDRSRGEGPEVMAVFQQGGTLRAFPIDGPTHLAPSLAMTVHKAQGSEFDHVALVLPDSDLPLLSRELIYTALTRARRSVLIVGSPELLARAVSRTYQRHSGVAEKLASLPQ
ncbi:MAG: exodeoxyribonuclease V subunit alpha, partial [Myxococcota bacterium]|nr:exodeoxyribonuclease V subunit alpha [Myxococcota bacterium]